MPILTQLGAVTACYTHQFLLPPLCVTFQMDLRSTFDRSFHRRGPTDANLSLLRVSQRCFQSLQLCKGL